MKPKFDRWYLQEMRAPDGSYIKRLQDFSKKELAEASDKVMWQMLFEREMFGTRHGLRVNPADNASPTTR